MSSASSLGATLNDATRVRIFVVNIESNWQKVAMAHNKAAIGSGRPTMSMVGVSALIDPDLLVEIRSKRYYLIKYNFGFLYKVKEIYYTLQGKVIIQANPPFLQILAAATFGQEEKKTEQRAVCKFCDTDFRVQMGSMEGVILLKICVIKLFHFFLLLTNRSLSFLRGGEPAFATR